MIGYIGSGIHLQRSIEKYGYENFKREVLEYSEDRSTLIDREISLITKEMLSDELCMNIKSGGIGGFTDEMRHNSHISRVEKTKNDPVYREFVSKLAKQRALSVTPQGREKCSSVLREKYKDEDFKKSQLEHRKLGSIKSWEPEAREKRAKNRQNKIDSGWVFVYDKLNRKRKFISPIEIEKFINNGWVICQSKIREVTVTC